MIHVKKKCQCCGEYTPCNGYQVINMQYCPKCRKKLKIQKQEYKWKPRQTICKKTDNKKMEKWNNG